MMGSTELRSAGAVVATVMFLSAACSGGGLPDAAEVTGAVVVDTGEADPRLRASLEHACIRAGGEQALTVRVEEGVGVRYLSTYADGEPGREAPSGSGYGGAGSTVSDGGLVETAWTVSPEAPAGLVVVYVSALLPGDGGGGRPPDQAITRLLLSYRLMDAGEECPEGEPEIPVPDVVTDTGDAHPRVRATLDHECLEVLGDQAQVLTVQGMGVVNYTTIYANGENGRPRPNGGGYGGSGFGLPDAEGVVKQGWALEEARTPPGVAVVLVKVSLRDGGEEEEEEAVLRLAFRVVGPGRECP